MRHGRKCARMTRPNYARCERAGACHAVSPPLSRAHRTVPPHPRARDLAGGGHDGPARADRKIRRRAQELCPHDGRGSADPGARGRGRDHARRDPRTAAWRADRGEGSVLDTGCADGCRHDDLPGLPSHRGCHGGAQAECGRRHHSGQAAAHRGRLRRSPPEDRAAREPLERGVLVRRLVEWFWRGNGCGALLRLARIRHRRFHPVPLRRQRRHRPQADLGPCQPPWRIRTGGDARSHRAHGTQRGGLRRDARRHCRQRSQ